MFKDRNSENGNATLTAIYGGICYPMHYPSHKLLELDVEPVPYYSTLEVVSSLGRSDTSFVEKEGSDCPAECTDFDGDGYGIVSGCTGPDCDDNDALNKSRFMRGFFSVITAH